MRTPFGRVIPSFTPPRRVHARALCLAALCCTWMLPFPPHARAQTGAGAQVTDPIIPKDSPLIVAIAPDNSLYVRRRRVPLDELEATVRSLTGELPEAERVVYVRSHLNAPYGMVVEVIETIRRAGVSRIALVADRRAPRRARPARRGKRGGLKGVARAPRRRAR